MSGRAHTGEPPAGPGAMGSAHGASGAGAAALARLRSVGTDPLSELAHIKERTGLMAMGYFDSYLPEELIMAHGIVPHRVTVSGRDDPRSHEFIQGYACPAARDLLEQALRGDLSLLDGVLFTRYCDSLRGVFAVWDSQKLSPFVDFVRYPTVVDTEGAVTYLAQELQEVSARIARALDAPLDERRLLDSIAACDRKRALVAELAARRATRDLPLAGADFLAVLVAATTMLPDEFTAALSTLLEHPPAGEPGDAVPVVLSGTTFDNIALAAAIESAGLYLAADDLSTGSRWYGIRVGSQPAAAGETPTDPWEALARAYLTKPPCSVKEPSSPRADHLVGLVRASAAEGVLFYLTKFCDSEQVEWPFLRDRLAREGIPVMMVEGDQKGEGSGALSTRLEAFRERFELGGEDS
ncbi:MAG TPA: 2-hydroxyacyl-CoA dehydratase family protein [Thermoleophilia bacterium]|nr:2-hydroxyacyl-CoA dehydratase family protein [Thermoleophilia bacterium]